MNDATRRAAPLIRRNRENPTQRRHSLDEHYFDRIETPDKAYWLGFLAGDGCLTNGGVSVNLSARDESHLHALTAALNATNPVRLRTTVANGKTYWRAMLAITSWRLAEALVSHGLAPRKSAVLGPWNGPAALMPHYWRGMVDADGTVSLAPGWGLSLVGTQAVATAFGTWAQSIEPGIAAQAHPHKSIWKFAIGGRVLARTVAQALYEDAATALPRKAGRAAALMASGLRPPKIRGTVSVGADGFRHGTTGYRRGCRCDECRAAHRVDAADYKVRRSA